MNSYNSYIDAEADRLEEILMKLKGSGVPNIPRDIVEAISSKAFLTGIELQKHLAETTRLDEDFIFRLSPFFKTLFPNLNILEIDLNELRRAGSRKSNKRPRRGPDRRRGGARIELGTYDFPLNDMLESRGFLKLHLVAGEYRLKMYRDNQEKLLSAYRSGSYRGSPQAWCDQNFACSAQIEKLENPDFDRVRFEQETLRSSLKIDFFMNTDDDEPYDSEDDDKDERKDERKFLYVSLRFENGRIEGYVWYVM
jgi:hypothetical protein